MSRLLSHIPITCQNPACRFYLIEEGKAIVKNGKTSCGHQQYFCKHCQKYFVETKNTPFYRSRLEHNKIETICRHSVEKTSIRGVSRITGHHQDTISRYYKLFGEHAEVLNEFFLQDLTPDRVEADELWTFIQKKNKNCNESTDQNCGDCWTYTAIASDSGLMIAHYGGKRTDTTCANFLDLVYKRLRLPFPSTKITITTDGNSQYINALADLYCEPCIEYGQLLKHKEKNKIVAINPKKIFGDLNISEISTSVVEGYNNKIRQRISRFGRKTASFSKKIVSYIGALNIFQFMNNFIDAKMGMTPAMKEGITDHVWTWREFLTYHIQL